jgi:hypothetical protein
MQGLVGLTGSEGLGGLVNQPAPAPYS